MSDIRREIRFTNDHMVILHKKELVFTGSFFTWSAFRARILAFRAKIGIKTISVIRYPH